MDIGGQVQPTERNCHLGGPSGSFGYNLATDASCGLDGPDDIVGEDDPLLGPLGDNGGPPLGPLGGNGGPSETLLPGSGSPVLDRMPTDTCDLAPFEGFLKEGDQHLEGLIDDRSALMLKDQRGVDRPQPQGSACDVGAVELEPVELEP
jgi:hypothetical protein